jgi:hypothetical protein
MRSKMSDFDVTLLTNATLVAAVISSGRCRVNDHRHQTTDVASNASLMTSSHLADSVVNGMSATEVNGSDVVLHGRCHGELAPYDNGLDVTVPPGFGRSRKDEGGHQTAARQLIVSVTLVVYTTVFAFGFLGNTLVIVVIVK